ncbi:hypothetical protein [Bacillus sp. V3-13]|uniref:hypothetical protein n=1 Tax=Bacillus sp. V3-13 TaxID=2053728 RepID=UPI00115BF042|nr:hypothetical protein [Bacillus sp. V3-13]
MRSFWIWFFFLAAALLMSVVHISLEANELALRMLFCALMLTAFFVSPLFRRKPRALTFVLCLAVLFASAATWP